MLALVAAAALAGAPSWCAAAERALAERADVEVVLAAVPKDVAARARADIGRAGDKAAAADVVAVAVRVGCAAVAVDVDAAARAAVAGPEFGGLRTDDDFSEKLFDRAMAWLRDLLETDAMQVFAKNTRIVYLAGLAFAVSLVAARLILRTRRVRKEREAVEALVRVERERARAFQEWRAEAKACVDALGVDVDAAALRRALLLWRAALLARVGEGDATAKDAVRPQRTSAELLARLAPAHAAHVAPPLAQFDDAYYGGRVDRAVVVAFAAAVDAAAAAVGKP